MNQSIQYNSCFMLDDCMSIKCRQRLLVIINELEIILSNILGRHILTTCSETLGGAMDGSKWEVLVPWILSRVQHTR